MLLFVVVEVVTSSTGLPNTVVITGLGVRCAIIPSNEAPVPPPPGVAAGEDDGDTRDIDLREPVRPPLLVLLPFIPREAKSPAPPLNVLVPLSPVAAVAAFPGEFNEVENTEPQLPSDDKAKGLETDTGRGVVTAPLPKLEVDAEGTRIRDLRMASFSPLVTEAVS